MAQLYLVRHAQASFGALDYDALSELGHQQSTLLGDYFAERQIQFDTTITGNMKRHKQTAQGILTATSSQSQSVDSNWNEFDFEAIVSAYLHQNPLHKPLENAPRSEWYKVLRQAMQMWANKDLRSYEGETWLDFVARVSQGMDKILNSGYKNVLVVTSGGAMAMFLMNLLNCSVSQAINFNLQIKNTSVNQFFFNPKGFQLSSFNNVPHLDSTQHQAKITYS